MIASQPRGAGKGLTQPPSKPIGSLLNTTIYDQFHTRVGDVFLLAWPYSRATASTARQNGPAPEIAQKAIGQFEDMGGRQHTSLVLPWLWMMHRMSDKSSDGLRERIALLRQDAAERPYLADVLLRIVDELEEELTRRASEEPPAVPDHSPETIA